MKGLFNDSDEEEEGKMMEGENRMMSEEHDVFKGLLGVEEDGKTLVWKNEDDADDATWDCKQVWEKWEFFDPVTAGGCRNDIQCGRPQTKERIGIRWRIGDWKKWDSMMIALDMGLNGDWSSTERNYPR